jgi:hypothetical protein
MKQRTLLAFVSLVLVGLASAQKVTIRVGEIEFYGYQNLDLDQIRTAIPVHIGEEFSPKETNGIKERIDQAVRTIIGRPPTDVATVCCDSSGNSTVYVGLPGKSSETIVYNPSPTGSVRLPAKALTLYQASENAVMHAVQAGRSGEDDSKGYSLGIDPALRAVQLQERNYATHNEDLLRRVLRSSSHADDREAAAELIGYANQSEAQILSLVHASYDSSNDVRNNAIRALGILAASNTKTASRIPASGFVEMLNSGVWTDRNKAGFVVMALTQSRNPQLLSELHALALPSLIEMAHWDLGHSYYARIILGRIAGIDEARLEKLAESGQADVIAEAASK